MPLNSGYTILLAGFEFSPPDYSIEWTGSHLLSSARKNLHPRILSPRRIHEIEIHFTMFYIVDAPIVRRSYHLFDIFPFQVCLLEMCLELHPCAIIVCNTLSHAIQMCILLCCEDFCDAHVCQLPIGKWRITRYCQFFPCFHLAEQDLYRVFDVVRHLHLILILH